MQGSINFDGSLVGNITGGGGGGDEVIITPVVTSGTKIADVSVGGVKKDLYTPDYGADIVALDGRLDIAEDNITSLTGRVGTAEGNITNLAGHMTEAETDITEIKQSLSDLETLEKTVSGAIVTFDDGSDLPMPSLKVSIEPVQSGSGDPSPDNIRPINGFTEANVVVSPTTDAEDGTTYNIQFRDGENLLIVYGGSLDVVSGVLTVDRVGVDLGTLTYGKAAAGLFRLNPNTIGIEIGSDMICSIYKQGTRTDYAGWDARENTFGWLSTNEYIIFKDSRYIEASDFKTAMNGVQLVYELATPLTIQLTPTQVKSLLGRNNAWANTGNIELTYLTNNPLTQTVYDMVKILVEQST